MTVQRREQLRTFANKMARGGLSYPGCGGGPALFPLQSVAHLRPDYGADIAKLSLELLLDYPDLDELVECTDWLAAGILLHLGDETVLATLQTVARRLLETKPHLNRAELFRLKVLEALVPTLAKELGLPIPEGFTLMDEQDEWLVFRMDR
jgi:hypothetical protein